MDDPRAIELLNEMLHNHKQIRDRMTEMFGWQTNGGLASINQRLERLEKEMETTNLKLQELIMFNLKLADELHKRNAAWRQNYPP